MPVATQAGISRRLSRTEPDALRHDKSGAIALKNRMAMPIGTAIELKYGGPTVTWPPLMAS